LGQVGSGDLGAHGWLVLVGVGLGKIAENYILMITSFGSNRTFFSAAYLSVAAR